MKCKPGTGQHLGFPSSMPARAVHGGVQHSTHSKGITCTPMPRLRRALETEARRQSSICFIASPRPRLPLRKPSQPGTAMPGAVPHSPPCYSLCGWRRGRETDRGPDPTEDASQGVELNMDACIQTCSAQPRNSEIPCSRFSTAVSRQLCQGRFAKSRADRCGIRSRLSAMSCACPARGLASIS